MAACLTHGSSIVLAIINAIELTFLTPERNPFSWFLHRDRYIPFTHIFLVFSFGDFSQKEVLFSKFDNQHIFNL
jgi:hypothetical protein